MGIELPQIRVSKNVNAKKYGLDDATKAFTKQTLQAALGRAGAKAKMKEDKEAWKERASRRVDHCEYSGCRTYEGLEPGLELLRCKACWERMKRRVLYCSASVIPVVPPLSQAPLLNSSVSGSARRQIGNCVTN